MNDLSQAIRCEIEGQARPIIGIDGVDGSGKTYLANGIAGTLKLPVVSVDDFVEKERGNYVEYVRYAELEAAFGDAREGVIVEGICLLDVLDRLRVSAACLVYVKRCDSDGLWYDDGDYDDPSGSAETVIARIAKHCAAIAELESRLVKRRRDRDSAESSITPLRAELLRYHYRVRPQERANHVYLRTQSS